MARVASHYTVDSHRILRTQIDRLLIAYDQAVKRLSLFDVSKQSEPLLCECGSINNSYYEDGKWGTYFCWGCKKELAK